MNRGPWLQTISGKAFYPRDPRVDEVDLFDIAHALSNTCRFAGHVKNFYSVAQHSVIVSEIVPVEHALAARLHDAAEAYVGDMIRPLKTTLPDYVAVEERIRVVIFERFGLDPELPKSVEHADMVALVTEVRDLIAKPDTFYDHVNLRLDGVEPLKQRIVPWSPARARWEFTARFEDLGR